MKDEPIGKWRQRGSVFLWRDPAQRRGFPGWNFAAYSDDGLPSVTELLSLMVDARWPASKTIALNTTDNMAPLILKRHNRPAQFTLAYPKGKVDDEYWQWSGTSAHPSLAVGWGKLVRIRDALIGLADRIDDLCIHPEGVRHFDTTWEHHSLWFWSIGIRKRDRCD